MESLFNVWADGQHSKTTILANSMPDALDIFCARHGFIDHADYCQEKQLTESNINIQEVNHDITDKIHHLMHLYAWCH